MKKPNHIIHRVPSPFDPFVDHIEKLLKKAEEQPPLSPLEQMVESAKHYIPQTRSFRLSRKDRTRFRYEEMVWNNLLKNPPSYFEFVSQNGDYLIVWSLERFDIAHAWVMAEQIGDSLGWEMIP